MNEPKKAVESLDFWEDRIYRQIAQKGMIHHIIYDNSAEVWNHVQAETVKVLRAFISQNANVLDAGCGYGALLDCFQRAGLPVRYTGVDLSPHLLRLARLRYPSENPPEVRWPGTFVEADLRRLPFRDGEFDWAVCRSIKEMIIKNVGEGAWEGIRKEVRRVARCLLVLEYPETKDEQIRVEVVA